jgi:hypothetical protein
MRGSLRLRHHEHRPAAAAGLTHDPRGWRCGPTVQGRVAGIARTLGYLERGWRTGDLVAFEHGLAELRQQLLTGQAPEPTRVVRLAEYAEPWFERIAAQVELGRMSPLTYNKYEGDWRLHLRPAFGRLPLPAIDDHAITRFVRRKLPAGLREATVKNSLIALSGMLTDAVADGPYPGGPTPGDRTVPVTVAAAATRASTSRSQWPFTPDGPASPRVRARTAVPTSGSISGSRRSSTMRGSRERAEPVNPN